MASRTASAKLSGDSTPTRTSYDGDVVAWADEQARLIRAGRFDELDLEHIADEIEDVGRSERRELVSRLSVLLMHLIKWQWQPSYRSRSWELTISDQRRMIARALERMPSLRPTLNDPGWIEDAWSDAVAMATRVTGIDRVMLPPTCPWTMSDVVSGGWKPGP
ncbi:MAG: DUF29 domain-containing protein [Gluconacetobacter diazotrophicus]|nr:DUF29 domain-containing protein [Gluconacetobacter diazotrophicus]